MLNIIRISRSLDVEQSQEARLKPNFSLHLLEERIGWRSLLLAADCLVNEVAPFTVHAISFVEIDSALFGFVLGVELLIFA